MVARPKDSSFYVIVTQKDYEDGYIAYKRECDHCGKTFYAFSDRRRYCSYRCKNDAYIKLEKQRRQMARNKVCEYCGEKFVAKRKDTKYCSPSHRVLACLKRKAF